MTNSYANLPQYYNQTGYAPENYYQSPKKTSHTGTILTAGAFLAGGTAGFFKNRYPVPKSGKVSDSFAQNAFEKHVRDNFKNEDKVLYKQTKKIINKIGKIRTPDGFKKLLNKNKEVLASVCAGMECSEETFLNSLTKENLKENKDMLKKRLKGINEHNYESFKNFIVQCWDKKEKKFVKPDGFDEKIFNSIKKAKSQVQWIKGLKYGAITAAVTAGVVAAYRIFVPKR